MGKVPKEEIEQRIRKFQSILAQKGVDGAFILQNVDIFYFSGTIQSSVLFIPCEGSPDVGISCPSTASCDPEGSGQGIAFPLFEKPSLSRRNADRIYAQRSTPKCEGIVSGAVDPGCAHITGNSQAGICPDSTAQVLPGFHHLHRKARILQNPSGHKSGHAGSDDQHPR
jgi:hypothetical protein